MGLMLDRHMRWLGAGLALMLLAAAAPAGYAIFASGNFEPGLWTIRPLDNATRTLLGAQPRLCLQNSEALVHAGFDPSAQSCTHNIVENGPDKLVLIYSCRGAGSGRTEIIRDARNHFTINAQGVDARGPFGIYAEYSRSGACPAGLPKKP